MSLSAAHVAHARQVADAILYEGYLLYPYRQSSRKNQARFQFGVLMPPAYAAVDDQELSASQTELLAECADDAQVEILLRFLHVQQRRVREPTGLQWRDVASLTVNGTEFTEFTEAAEREQRVELSVGSLYGAGAELPFHIDGGEITDDLPGADATVAGRLVHRWDALDGVLRVQGERVAGPYQALRLRLRVENATQPEVTLRTREDGLRFALIAAHTVIGLAGGTFISMTDHPEWAAAEVAACANTGTWPVLAGPDECRNLVLSSPIILYDHPQIAPESAGDLFDATEIDEILTLRTMALTDEEKREARATDPRAADLIDRLDGLPPEMMERLHGAIRYLEPGVGPVSASPGQPGPGPEAAGSPGTLAGPAGPRPAEAGPAGPGQAEAGPAGPGPAKQDRPGRGRPKQDRPGRAGRSRTGRAEADGSRTVPGGRGGGRHPGVPYPDRALVGSWGRHLGLAANRSRHDRRSPDRAGGRGADAARCAARRRPGSLPDRPGGHGRGRAARRGRAGARGGAPTQRSHHGRVAARPGTVPVLRPGRAGARPGGRGLTPAHS